MSSPPTTPRYPFWPLLSNFSDSGEVLLLRWALGQGESSWVAEMGAGEAEAGHGPTQPNRRWGWLQRAGATGTSRLCEAPGGPGFSEKPRTESPEWLEGQSRGRGPRWCPPSPHLLPASPLREKRHRGVWKVARLGARKQPHRCVRTGRDQDVGKGQGSGVLSREEGLQAQGKLRQGLRTQRDWGKGGLCWKSLGTETSKGKSIFSPGVGTE